MTPMVFLECNCKTVSVSPTQSMLVVMVEEGSYWSSDQNFKVLSYLRGVRPCSTSKTSKLYVSLQHIIRRYSLIVTFHLVLESFFQRKSTTSFALEKKNAKTKNHQGDMITTIFIFPAVIQCASSYSCVLSDTAGRLWYLNPPYLREIVLPSSQGGYVFAVQPSHDQAEG